MSVVLPRWSGFASEAPELAASGHKLLYHYGPGLGFLATVDGDGGPRVHPVCPVIANDGLYVFIGNHSPKVRDLLRDRRFALHSFPLPEVDDEFYVKGVAHVSEEADVRDVVYAAYTATGATTSDDTLFELLIERVMLARYGPRPSWPPEYVKWRAARPAGVA
ncbi:MAG TPA: pyridoxamine 5'-phosphate oxidase family protein [Acidimicrobiales bacterium]|nr:pyridoxamine 5'-phosphate oxidase family protein [Acidimicrobiales bacterium]